MSMFKAKRKAPREVPPVTHEGVRYEYCLDGAKFGFPHQGGVLAAYDAKTGQKLWAQLIYQVAIREDLERDAQLSYINSIELSKDGQSLIIGNERGEQFSLKLLDRTVTKM